MSQVSERLLTKFTRVGACIGVAPHVDLYLIFSEESFVAQFTTKGLKIFVCLHVHFETCFGFETEIGKIFSNIDRIFVLY